MKVHIFPDFGQGPDQGDGGVRRVVEAQRRYLPDYGVELVGSPDQADVLASHIMAPRDWFTRYADKPLVAHNHGFYWSEYDWSGDWAGKANAEVMRLVKGADLVTAPSEWVAQIIRRHSARYVVTIPHGIAPDDFEGEHGGYVLWNKTRADPVCDPWPAVEVANRLPMVTVQTTFLPEHGPGRVPGNIDLIGREPWVQAVDRVRHAGVYLATTRETFGIGTLEAMAAGVPIVGFRWAGQEEIITHLRDGYLAEVDDYDDLARGVLWALKYRDEVGALARQRAADFSWEDAVRQYANIYQRLFDDRQEATPRVSIVVTAYNVAEYLAETLTSVQMQRDPGWECVIVDDASPDASGAIADAFSAQDSRFRVIHNRQNVNTPEARNIGIRASVGRYILPLDGDDTLDPGTVAVLADALDADRSIWVAYGNVQFRRQDGAAGHSGWPVDFDIGRFFTGPGQPMPYSSMYRRDAWQLTGGYRPRVRSSEDCDLGMRMTSYGFASRMVTKADTLIYRLREGSRSDTEGHADEENKTWYPWRRLPAMAPAACRELNALAVPSLDPPLISVIIPVGPGHEQLVRDAVDSVDAQTFRAWECIVVNDSGHELPELPAWCIVLEDSSSFYDETKHLGTAAARNAAIEASRGVCFLPLDADDLLMPDALQSLYDVWARGDGRDIVYADFWEDPGRAGDFKVYTLADYDPALMLKKALYPVTALTPKQAWVDAGGYDSTAPWEDWDFQLKTAEACYCGVHIAEPLWTYRKHTGTRRVDRFQRKAEAEAAMLLTWGDFIEGRRELMAASCCGGRLKNAPAQSRALLAAQAPTQAVKIRYNSARRGRVNFTGQRTGTVYWFDAGEEKFVHAADAPYFLEKTFFEQVDGPPVAMEPAPVGAAAQGGGFTAPQLIAHERDERETIVAVPGQVRHVTEPMNQTAATLDLPPSLPGAGQVHTLADLPPDPDAGSAAALPEASANLANNSSQADPALPGPPQAAPSNLKNPRPASRAPAKDSDDGTDQPRPRRRR